MKNIVSDMVCFLLQWFVVFLIISVIVSVVGAGVYITYKIFTHGYLWQIILWIIVVSSFFVTLGYQEGEL